MGFIESLEDLKRILSTRNGRVLFTINLASAGAILFIAIWLYLIIYALTPTINGGF